MLYLGSFDVFLPSSNSQDLNLDKDCSYEALCTVNWARNLGAQKDAQFLLRHMVPHGNPGDGPDDKLDAYRTPVKSPVQARLDAEFSRAVFSPKSTSLSPATPSSKLSRRAATRARFQWGVIRDLMMEGGFRAQHISGRARLLKEAKVMHGMQAFTPQKSPIVGSNSPLRTMTPDWLMNSTAALMDSRIRFDAKFAALSMLRHMNGYSSSVKLRACIVRCVSRWSREVVRNKFRCTVKQLEAKTSQLTDELATVQLKFNFSKLVSTRVTITPPFVTFLTPSCFAANLSEDDAKCSEANAHG